MSEKGVIALLLLRKRSCYSTIYRRQERQQADANNSDTFTSEYSGLYTSNRFVCIHGEARRRLVVFLRLLDCSFRSAKYEVTSSLERIRSKVIIEHLEIKGQDTHSRGNRWGMT
jgi:hypothetical protein